MAKEDSKLAVDPYNGKVLVTLKDWYGARPEFLVDSSYSSYSIDVISNTAGG